MVYNLPRSASVRAATPCVIFLLDRADLKRVLKHYPEGQVKCLINPLPSASSLDNPGGMGERCWAGVCGPLLKTQSLFKTKIGDFTFPYSIPYQEKMTLFMTGQKLRYPVSDLL